MKLAKFPELVKLINELIYILSKENPEDLDRSGFIGPSSPQEYIAALKEYIRNEKLSPIPESELLNVEIYPSKTKGRLRTDVDLWVGGNKSDLTAILYFTPESQNNNLELYDLRVL